MGGLRLLAPEAEFDQGGRWPKGVENREIAADE
jgi:hypothetical protein